jgi:hypothetical protein
LYILGAMRLLAALMILGFVTMYAVLYVRSRRRKHRGDGGDSDHAPGAGAPPKVHPRGTH